MKQIHILSMLICLGLLGACSGNGETTDSKEPEKAKKEDTQVTPETPATIGPVSCEQLVAEYTEICNSLMALANSYYDTGVLDEAKRTTLDEKSRKFNSDWNQGDASKYSKECLRKYQATAAIAGKAGLRFSEAMQKHMRK